MNVERKVEGIIVMMVLLWILTIILFWILGRNQGYELAMATCEAQYENCLMLL